MNILNIALSPFMLIKNIVNVRVIDKHIKTTTINQIDALNGYEFETYLEKLLKTMGYNSITTKKSGDYGADIVAKNRKEVLVVQAKLYFNHSVGLKSVQEVKSAKDYYKADKAIVITNSHFTSSSKNLAKSTLVSLIDREKLIALISTDKKTRKSLFFNYINTIE